MIDCNKFKKDFVAFLYGELQDSDKELLKSHIDTCPNCRRELEELKEIRKGADVLHADIEEAMASVDWESLPSQITEKVFEKEVGAPREFWLEKAARLLFQPRLRPVYAALLVGIVIGTLVTLMVFRTPVSIETKAGEFFAPKDFLEKVELEMARRETMDYLDKSQYLILDFIQAPSEESAEFWQGEFTSKRARDLLAKKKYINPQLDKFQMAKAKAICDQIELLFYELAQISVELSAEEIKKIQKMIEDKQILLKISILKKELEQSEV